MVVAVLIYEMTRTILCFLCEVKAIHFLFSFVRTIARVHNEFEKISVKNSEYDAALVRK